MKEKDGELLARIDERTNNIWRTVEAMEKHQLTQNGFIKELFKTCNANTVWRRVIIGVGTTVLLGIISWLFVLSGIKL